MDKNQVCSVALMLTILILCLILVSSAASASSTVTETRINRTDENSTIRATKYTISPFPSNQAGVSINGEKVIGFQKHKKKSMNYIVTGQTKIHSVNVGSGANFLEVDLDWGNKRDKLRLSTYTPSGSKLTTYSDNNDGNVDGRIHISISPDNGYVEQGTWQFKIYGKNVSKKKTYIFNVYQH